MKSTTDFDQLCKNYCISEHEKTALLHVMSDLSELKCYMLMKVIFHLESTADLTFIIESLKSEEERIK